MWPGRGTPLAERGGGVASTAAWRARSGAVRCNAIQSREQLQVGIQYVEFRAIRFSIATHHTRHGPGEEMRHDLAAYTACLAFTSSVYGLTCHPANISGAPPPRRVHLSVHGIRVRSTSMLQLRSGLVSVPDGIGARHPPPAARHVARSRTPEGARRERARLNGIAM